jgi:hypothetical protein
MLCDEAVSLIDLEIVRGAVRDISAVSWMISPATEAVIADVS